MLIGNVAQQLYNTADSIIVGRYIGDNALAAVGSGAHPPSLARAFRGHFHGRRYHGLPSILGAKDRENLSRAIGNSLTQTALASLLIMVTWPTGEQAVTYSFEYPAFNYRLVRGLPEYFLPGRRRLCFLQYARRDSGAVWEIPFIRPGLFTHLHWAQCRAGYLICRQVQYGESPAWLWPQSLPRGFRPSFACLNC